MMTKPSSGESLLPNGQRQRGDLLDVQNELVLGCPRNNKKCFRFELKQTKTQSVSVVFRFVSRNQNTFLSVCFGLFRYFGLVSKQPKQTEFCRNKQKKSPKNVPYWGSSKQLICFLGLNRNKPKLSLFRLFFDLLFRETKKFCLSVCFDVSDRYRNN